MDLALNNLLKSNQPTNQPTPNHFLRLLLTFKIDRSIDS